jgi:hypothetical protein
MSNSIYENIYYCHEQIDGHLHSLEFWKNVKKDYEKQLICIHKWKSVPERKEDMMCFDAGEAAYIECVLCYYKIHSDSKFKDERELFLNNWSV